MNIVEDSKIEKILTIFESAVQINDEDFFASLEWYVIHKRDKSIADIINEYAQSEAENIELADLIRQYGDERIDGKAELISTRTIRERLLYCAEQDIRDQLYRDVYVANKKIMTGIQSIVGYIVFYKAYGMSNVDISQEQFDKLNKYIEDKGDDANLCIADIEKKVADICWTQRHIDGEYTEKQQTQKARKQK